MAVEFGSPPKSRHRVLFCLGATPGCACEGEGFETHYAADPNEARAALVAAKSTGAQYSVAIMPLCLGEWAELLEVAHLSDAACYFILEADQSIPPPPSLPEARRVVFNAPLDMGVALPLLRHLLARREEEQASAKPGADLLEVDKKDGARLETLYAIVEKLHGERSFVSGLAAAMSEMARFLNAKTASLMVLEDDHTLTVLEALGPNRQRIIGQTLPLAQSRVARHAISSGAPILVTDMRDDARFGESTAEMRYRSRSVLSVPIFSKDGPIAVVNLGGNNSEATFGERDREFVVTMSRQLAIALEKNKLFEELRTAVSGSIRALANAIEAKDTYTKGHSDRVTYYAILVAEVLGMGPEELEVLKQASILHDVGKIGVPGGVLHKPGRLDDMEYRLIQRHPGIGISIVRQIGAMDQTLPIIRSHHERVDGHGYPDGLGGEEIPLGARIVAVADTFDAMTSNRPYRSGLPFEAAIEEIHRCSGTQFDPAVVKAFLENISSWPVKSAEKSQLHEVS